MSVEHSYLPPKTTPGALRRVTLSDEEMYSFLTVLAKNYSTSNFDVIHNLFGPQFLYFMDLFAGDTIQVPKRKELEKLILYTRVYHYFESRSFNDDVKKSAMRIFELSATELERIITFMNEILKEEDIT